MKAFLFGTVVTLMVAVGVYLLLGFFVSDDREVFENKQVIGTLSDVYALGHNLECAFEFNEGSIEVQGTVYVTIDTRMRVDSAVYFPERGLVSGYRIEQDGYAYTWGLPDIDYEGIKRPLQKSDELETKQINSSQPTDALLDLSSRFTTYSCELWEVEESYFDPPRNVDFTDVSPPDSDIPSDVMRARTIQCDACEEAGSEEEIQLCKETRGCF
jgi:hypothetical protein